MSGMMLHGLGDCTPELNCGCMAKSPRDGLRERIARALWEFPLNDCHCPAANPCGWCKTASEEMADAVIAALGLEEQRSLGIESGSTWENLRNYRRRRYVTPWERIEEDG